MIQRCTNPNNADWDDYGGRGIVVHPSWRDSYEAFLSDLGRRPTTRHSLDRIDVNGGYVPGNVRWATPEQQARNKRNTVTVELDGKRIPLVDACSIKGVPYMTAIYRRYRGWDESRWLDPEAPANPASKTMPAKAPRMALVIDETVKQKIQFLASKHRRSTSAEIVVAVEKWIEDNADEMAGFTESN